MHNKIWDKSFRDKLERGREIDRKRVDILGVKHRPTDDPIGQVSISQEKRQTPRSEKEGTLGSCIQQESTQLNNWPKTQVQCKEPDCKIVKIPPLAPVVHIFSVHKIQRNDNKIYCRVPCKKHELIV